MAPNTSLNLDYFLDYIANPTGSRTVTAIVDGDGCCNCYDHGFPCANHRDMDITAMIMTWDDFINKSNGNSLIMDFGKIPESYKEYCELYMNIPDLLEEEYYEDEDYEDEEYDRLEYT